MCLNPDPVGQLTLCPGGSVSAGSGIALECAVDLCDAKGTRFSFQASRQTVLETPLDGVQSAHRRGVLPMGSGCHCLACLAIHELTPGGYATTTGWQAQLILTIPLYDGGTRYGLRRERSALYEESKAQLEGLLRQARSDVRGSFEAVRRADESVRSARQAARLAHDALDMTMLAYREGATNDLEVVDAARTALVADVAALSAEDTARQARIDLLSASGRFP